MERRDMGETRCRAWVQHAYRESPCTRKARYVVDTLVLCASHAKQAERWAAAGKLLKMAQWLWRVSPSEASR
jgi:hypothetical protein